MIYTIKELIEFTSFSRGAVTKYVQKKPFKKVIVGTRVNYETDLDKAQILELFRSKKSINKSKNIIKYHKSKGHKTA